MSVADLIESAFAGMDRDGMYPAGLRCKNCNRVLNADGNHPAELYAGTYNGLCYPCTNEYRYITDLYVLDGARLWSYSPHCPSWRRDRETAYGYADCAECKGTGLLRDRNWHGRDYCTTCRDRFYNHPLRKRHSELTELTMRLFNAKWQWAIIDLAGIGASERKAVRKQKRHDYPRDELGRVSVVSPRAKTIDKALALIGSRSPAEGWTIEATDETVTVTNEAKRIRLGWGFDVAKTGIFRYVNRKDFALWTCIDGQWLLVRAPYSTLQVVTDDLDEVARKLNAHVWTQIVLGDPLREQHKRIEAQLKALGQAWRIYEKE